MSHILLFIFCCSLFSHLLCQIISARNTISKIIADQLITYHFILLVLTKLVHFNTRDTALCIKIKRIHTHLHNLPHRDHLGSRVPRHIANWQECTRHSYTSSHRDDIGTTGHRTTHHSYCSYHSRSTRYTGLSASRSHPSHIGTARMDKMCCCSVAHLCYPNSLADDCTPYSMAHTDHCGTRIGLWDTFGCTLEMMLKCCKNII